MASSKITLFLFDLDGTLVSTGGAGLRALQKTFQDHYDIGDVMQKVSPSGKTDPAIFREIIQTYVGRDMTESEFDKIKQHYLSHLENEMKNSPDLRVLPGVVDLLRELIRQDDVLVGLGTGNLEPGARLKLAPTGLNAYFSFGGFGSDSEIRSEVLKFGHKRAEDQAGVSIPSECVYIIGDTELDIRASHQAGYRSIGVATGSRTYDQLKAHNPHYLMNDFTENEIILTDILQIQQSS